MPIRFAMVSVAILRTPNDDRDLQGTQRRTAEGCHMRDQVKYRNARANADRGTAVAAHHGVLEAMMFVHGAKRIRVACLALVALLAVTGCHGGTVGSQDDPVATAIDRLAAAGIAVFDDPADPAPIVAPAEPVSPVRLLSWQLRALVAEADAHAGFGAEGLDAIVDEEGQLGEVAMSPAQLIASWVKYGDTPAAEYARDLVRDIPTSLEAVVFPKLVLQLFASDIATAGASLRATGGGGGTMGSAAHHAQDKAELSVSSAPCSSLVNWVDGTIARVFNAIGHLQLEVHTDLGKVVDSVASWLAKGFASAVNLVIDGAHFVINKTVRVLVAPVIAFVGRVAGIVGTIAQVASFVRPWSPSLIATPRETQKAVRPAQGLPGDFTLKINVGGLDEWPPALADCAAQAGAPLPPLKPHGNPVSWDITDHGLIRVENKDAALRQDATAVARYRTTEEDAYHKSIEQFGLVIVSATVQRDDVINLQKQFVKLLEDAFGQVLPPLVDDIVKPQLRKVIQPIAAKAFKALEHLRDERVNAILAVTYHEPDEDPDSGSSSPPPPPSSIKKAVIPTRCPSSSTVGHGYSLIGRDTRFGEAGTVMCAYAGAAPVQLVIGVLPRAYTTPEQKYVADEPISIPGTDEAWIDARDCGGGTTCFPMYLEVGDRGLQINGATSRNTAIDIAKRVLRLK